MKLAAPFASLGNSPLPQRRGTGSVVAIALTAVLAYQVALSLYSRIPVFIHWARVEWGERGGKQLREAEGFSWSALESSKDLSFKPCYDGLKCARLELPLDYWNGTNPDKTISLAIIKVPAKVPVSDSRYGGPILVNPGGPGGSGVWFVVSAGKALQILVDSAEEPTFTAETGLKSKYYDIIGFDPRGVGETTPGAFCFEDGPTSWSWALREKEDGIIGSSDAALGRLWGMNQALGTSCSHHSESGDDIKKFMTTASVARDMLEIVEKHAEWKSYETQRISDEIFKRAVERSRKTGYRALPSTPKYVPYIRGKASLQYWGVSYGSFLGNTFASMYPSRVGRLILDGVVDAEDYLQTLWYDNLNDTEKVMSSFYTYCAAAGFPACALASPNATAPDISIRLATIVRSLYHAPLPVPGDTPEVITYSDARRLIFSALYSPLAYFPLVAELMAAIERRDGSAFADLLTPTHSFSCAWNDSNALAIQSAAQYAILCSDGDTQTSMSPDDFASYVDDLESLSPSIGAIWAQIRLRCTAWDVRPLYRFRGPMGGKTSTPVLWIGNTADPVTPLGNAHKMAGLFEGSVVLTQESAGHCSLSAPSSCTLAHVRNYLHQGILPPPDTVCVPDTVPFGAPRPSLMEVASDVLPLLQIQPELREAARGKLLAAQEQLSEAWFTGGWGLGKEGSVGIGMGKVEGWLVKMHSASKKA